jgi:hypothetical protein
LVGLESIPESAGDFAQFGQIGEGFGAITFVEIISDAGEVKGDALEVFVYVVGCQRTGSVI